jgi:hypothetical protein
MSMSSGADPERDDFGLPSIDIKIPDDARELDREVHAYHRELRMLRRRRLARRLSGPLTRHGLLLPLLASCLALTLLAGTLLTVLSASQGSWLPTSPSRASRAPSAPAGQRARAGQVGQPLPQASVLVGGKQTSLRRLTASVLAIVPPGCRCKAVLRKLSGQAGDAEARMYLVGMNGLPASTLARQVGLRPSQAVDDPGNVLVNTYHPDRLTAILVRPSGIVAAVVPSRSGGFRLQQALLELIAGGPLGLPGSD